MKKWWLGDHLFLPRIIMLQCSIIIIRNNEEKWLKLKQTAPRGAKARACLRAARDGEML